MNKINKLLKNPWLLIYYPLRLFSFLVPDKLFLSIKYKTYLGTWINWHEPKTFTEKLQYLKVYDRKPVYSMMVDKYAVKEYVASIIGSEHIIPTIAVYDSIDEIDLDMLPNQFVLKTTHCGGGNGIVICKDKETFDLNEAKKRLTKSLKTDLYIEHREWPYKQVQHKIIAEKFMQDSETDVLTDYKFFCFDGEPQIMYISKDFALEATTDFFDMDFRSINLRMKHSNSPVPPKKPEQFELMKDYARKLSRGIPHVRVDFYIINGILYFGELTFYHNSGFCKIHPDEWNYKLGEMIKIPRR